ncbi:MAG: hypothetical protein K1X36_08640 [Pyrinomonadaceae bacterium]|nr:hypothetical protein [Pyrinomonadaceae bacterium]
MRSDLNFPSTAKLYLITMIFIFIFGSAATGQTAVFGVPTAEIHEKRSLYIEADLFAHFDRFDRGGFRSFGPSVIYGVNKRLEVGVNLYATQDGVETTVELEPNIKYKALDQKDIGVDLAVGAVAYVPLNRSSDSKASAMLYTVATRKFNSAKNLALTGGIYHVVGGPADIGTRTGILVGAQQPVTKRLTLMADWTSGKNRFGYSNAGFGYEVTSNQYLMVGYAFGNSGRANNYLNLFYGFTF